jgi:CheY-like chemotaxis protein
LGTHRFATGLVLATFSWVPVGYRIDQKQIWTTCIQMTVEPSFFNPEPPAPGKGVILVVDDEHAFCDVVCEILEAIGYRAYFALDAAQALHKLPQVKPDVVLTDVMMPDMDGLSFVRYLREQPNWASTPVVIISAKATQEDRRKALESGADEFLAKPFSSYDLEELIERILQLDGR